MKILVTGANGQLGADVMKELRHSGLEAVGVDIAEMDITDAASVRRVMNGVRPDAVIHCAAWTAVDLAEDEDKRDTVYRVNALGTEHIAKACVETHSKLLYTSTDYVFDGQGGRPWEPDDERHPLNVYGQSKYEGELAVERLLRHYFIVRIAWVFGPSGNNFVKTMLQLGKERKSLTVVDDQYGTPTYTPDLAKLLVQMVQTERYGRYHATNEGGFISWYDFAGEIFRQAAQIDPVYDKVTVKPVSSRKYKTKAKRPLNSRLSKQKLTDNGFAPLPDWRDALRRFLKEIEG